MHTPKRIALLAVIATLAATLLGGDTYACRIVDPHPRPRRPRPRPSVLKPILTRYHSADIKVKNQVAEVQVNATFYNPNAQRIEGTYWFPLPAEAAVKDFRMEINGKLVQGELLDAKRAKKIYEDIVRKQKDPALLEWVGSQMLKCRVFPMEANKETKVALTYTQMLKEDGGLVRLNYPLRSAKPNAGTIDQLVIKVAVESTVPIKAVYAATHRFDVNRKNDNNVLLTFEGKAVNPTRDVEIVFSRDAGDVGLSVLSHKAKSQDGVFLLTVTPKVKIEADKVIKKDIIFVCDTSGSMQGDGKIEQAKKALKFCVRSLNKGDRFNIIAFSGDVRHFRKAFVERSNESLNAADDYIDSMRAVGGTAINDALLAALEVAKSAENVPMIIFLTDGNPTIGEQNVKTILKNISAANKAKCRLFVFGVGYDVNTKLLDLLAEENTGVREYVKPKEDIEVKVSAFYMKVANPILSDIAVDFGDANVEQVYPRKLPDLFHGGQLTMFGRFKKPGKFDIKLTGKAGGESKTFTYTVKLQETNADDYLPRLWALRKVAFLLDEIRLHGENKELVAEVTRLGKLHGIITPYTSFLVIEEGAPLPPAVRAEMEAAARESRRTFARKEAGRGAVQDSGVIAHGKGGALGGRASSGAGQAKPAGSFGVHRSKKRPTTLYADLDAEQADEKFQGELLKAVEKIIRQVGAKTFYVNADGLWTDSTYDKKDAAKITDIKLWSDAFHKLAKEHPEIGKYLADTKKLIVVIDSEIYRIR